MTNRFGRVPLPAEMSIFKAEVGGDQELVIFRYPQNGSIVAEPDGDRAPRGS